MSQLRKALGKLLQMCLPRPLLHLVYRDWRAESGATEHDYYLNQHPQILSPSNKEVDYLGNKPCSRSIN